MRFPISFVLSASLLVATVWGCGENDGNVLYRVSSNTGHGTSSKSGGGLTVDYVSFVEAGETVLETVSTDEGFTAAVIAAVDGRRRLVAGYDDI